jgi:hypothetical protein
MGTIPPWIRALLYVMIVGGAFVSFLVAGRALWLHKTIAGFEETVGTVSTSEIHSGSDALAFVADYEVDGKGYKANSWMGIEGAGDRSDEEIVASYPVGTKLPVYYDPKHPERATLSRDVQVAAPIVTAMVLVLVTGWVMMRLRPTR